MTTLKDVRTIAIPVTNQDNALAYYVETLGLEKRLDAVISPTLRWIEVAPAGASVSIALTPAQGEGVRSTDTGVRFTVPDAVAEHDSMQERGVNVGDLQNWDGVPPMFSFDDPDGNRFYVVEEMD